MGEAKLRKEQFRKTPPVCVFCGVRDGTTKDHVPPKGMFPPPRPNLITVPACAACNGGVSAIDERFRTMLSLKVGAGTAETKLFWQALTLPGLQKNQRYRRELAEGVKTAVVKHPNGEVLGKVPVIRWDVDTHDSTIARIARGLYYHEFRTVLSPDAPICAYYFPELDAELREVFSAGRVRQVGEVFEYSVLQAEDDPTATIWLFNFYSGRHVAGAATGLMALDDDGEDSDAADDSGTL